MSTRHLESYDEYLTWHERFLSRIMLRNRQLNELTPLYDDFGTPYAFRRIYDPNDSENFVAVDLVPSLSTAVAPITHTISVLVSSRVVGTTPQMDLSVDHSAHVARQVRYHCLDHLRSLKQEFLNHDLRPRQILDYDDRVGVYIRHLFDDSHRGGQQPTEAAKVQFFLRAENGPVVQTHLTYAAVMST